MIRALIVDDEPLARQRLEDLLAKEPDVELAGVATNGNEAVESILSLKPDLVFLDIQMPGRSGLQVVEAVGPECMPATIFVTAFDQFALKAFDIAATDYLVKPFDDERFQQALRRARRSLELHEVQEMTQRLLTLIQAAGSEPARAPGQAADSPDRKYLDRIAVESRGQVRVVPVERIDYITASGPYAELHIMDKGTEKVYAVRERMQTLEEQLDPATFFRIHRSAIVRLDRIDTLLRNSGGDYGVRLKSGVELSVSRSRWEELEAKMGIQS
jgi:two-component system, LytTR family, response regulator